MELAEWLFGAGDDSAARAELATLKASRQTARGAWAMAAELFEERGELGEAHEWFTMATTRLTQAELSAAAGDFGWATLPGQLVRARRRVRTAIGLPHDATDQLLPADEVIASMARELDEPTDGAHIARMLFWPRADYPEFQQRWPAEEAAAIGEVEYYRRLQRNLEQLADDGAAQVLAVPADVSDYTAELVANRTARRRYLNDRVDAGLGISWPPGRNEPCWCGSGSKYKKCCARPAG